MKRTLIAVISCSSLISGIIVVASFWPTNIQPIIICGKLILVLLLLMGPWILLVGVIWIVQGIRKFKEMPRNRVSSMIPYAFGLSIIIATILLADAGMFMKIPFMRHLPDFKSATSEIDFSKPGIQDLQKKLGIWNVDQCGVDEQGGVYFRIDMHEWWMIQWSFGFACRPDERTSPFGREGYMLRPMVDDWYYFKVKI